MNKQKTITALLFVLAGVCVWLFVSKPADLTYRQAEGQIFGTTYHVSYEASSDMHESIQSALVEVDACLSMFNDSSLISRINRGEWVETDSLFDHLYAQARQVSALSDGAFDITVAPLVELWGFGHHTGSVSEPDSATVDSVLAFVGWQHILLDNHHLIKDDARITLDAGAIAKGLGCDHVANRLNKAGVRNYLVEIGGEVVLQGVNSQSKPWRVGITNPKDHAAPDDLNGVVEGTHLCMATSGNYRQYYYHHGVRRSHTIDPRSGYPVQHRLLSATVISDNCMQADALATACMVLGEEQVQALIDNTPHAAYYLIVADGDLSQVWKSDNWPDDSAK